MGKHRGKELTMVRRSDLRNASALWGPLRINAERSRQPWKRVSRQAFEEALDALGLDKPSDDNDGKTPALAKNGVSKEKQ
jgi:hypothetical protein